MRPGVKLYGFDQDQPKKMMINGPRPSPLMINKDSHIIRKPSTSVDAETKFQKPQRIKPIIIYTHSPKVIHTKAKDFMALVQRLTGRSSTNTSTNDDMSNASVPQEVSENFGSSLSDGSNYTCNETSSAFKRGDENLVESGGNTVQNSTPSYLDFVDMPLFTPNSSDFLLSARSSVYKYSDSPYGVLGNLISPSALEFMKELPEY